MIEYCSQCHKSPRTSARVSVFSEAMGLCFFPFFWTPRILDTTPIEHAKPNFLVKLVLASTLCWSPDESNCLCRAREPELGPSSSWCADVDVELWPRVSGTSEQGNRASRRSSVSKENWAQNQIFYPSIYLGCFEFGSRSVDVQWTCHRLVVVVVFSDKSKLICGRFPGCLSSPPPLISVSLFPPFAPPPLFITTLTL